MKQPCDHSAVIQFFAVCESSGIGLRDMIVTASVVNDAAASYGPRADDLWDAVNAALVGEYGPLRLLGVDLQYTTDALQTISHSRRAEYRLVSIRKHLQSLVSDNTPGLLGGRFDGS